MWIIALIIAIAIIALIIIKAGTLSISRHPPLAPPASQLEPLFRPKKDSKVKAPDRNANLRKRHGGNGFNPRQVSQDENAPCFVTGQPIRLCECPEHKEKGKKIRV